MGFIKRPKKKSRGKAAADFNRRERMKVYNKSLWRNLRNLHLREHPLCEICSREGRVTPGTDVHHKLTFTSAANAAERDRIAYDPDNLLTVCDRCHQRLHHGDLKGSKL